MSTDDLTELEKEEEQSFFEDESDQQPPSDIIAYNELRSCADLFRMYDKGILDITPDFQRDSVWNPPAQTRFIDSLIKQLPIPSMCFSLDFKTQKWQVIDGLQRMTAIIRFLDDKSWRLSDLDDIDKKLAGKKVSHFKDEDSVDHILYQRLENLTLPVTVLRCDHSKKSHMEYLFTIFHRLNTGGTKLNNQEIRNCIFSGSLNSLLKELNENTHWRAINRLKDKDDSRFKYVEMILRHFAFNDDLLKYKGILSKFLNEYMRVNRAPSEDFLQAKKDNFLRTVKLIEAKVLPGDERVGISTLEALLAGVSANIDSLELLSKEDLTSRFLRLKEHSSLATEYLNGGVAKKDKVEARISASIEIFS
ncbi:DUF262 domain-containing protein [Shewanella sp. MF05960]|uniref:DUF262 domain-containing protein n=1 Tax=Shewanella sp. MF05960 TaxID=3434874 RepID=UPI003D7A1C9D